MQKVLERRRFGSISKTFANEIFNGFDVMIRARFNLLDTLGVVQREVVNHVIQDVFHHGGERREFGDRCFIGKALEPPHLDQHPETDQAILAKDVAKLVCLVGIPAIGRRKGSQR